jgi:UDP-N-acetylglucosamine pyrophosphorylase
VQVEKMRKKFGSDVKFVMMNSFSTSADTKEHLSKTHPDLVAKDGWELVQNKSPKVDASTMDPVTYSENPNMEWCASCSL